MPPTTAQCARYGDSYVPRMRAQVTLRDAPTAAGVPVAHVNAVSSNPPDVFFSTNLMMPAIESGCRMPATRTHHLVRRLPQHHNAFCPTLRFHMCGTSVPHCWARACRDTCHLRRRTRGKRHCHGVSPHHSTHTRRQWTTEMNKSLADTDPELFDIIEHEKRRQRENIVLIASEVTCAPALHRNVSSHGRPAELHFPRHT